MNDLGITISKGKYYTSHDACRMAGITYRQLDYWLRVGIIKPECVANPGSGGRRRFKGTEVRRLVEMVNRLHEAHATIAKFRTGELWREATGESVEVAA